MHDTRGFSLVEVLISAALVVSIIALTCILAMEGQTAWRTDNARIDLQQRARVAADVLTRSLLEAGGGSYSGAAKGTLLRVLPPVLPRRVGIRGSDPPGTFRTDAISVLYATAEAEHTSLLIPAPTGTAAIEIVSSSCALPACGFVLGSSLMVHDSTGNYDVFTVTDVQGSTLALRHNGPGSVVAYPAGSPVIHVQSRSYYLDRPARILRVYDGDASDLPLLDDVVEMEVEYSGVVLPPLWPRPVEGQSNCLYDADGTYRASLMPVLSASTSPTALDAAIFSDGPWCGGGGNQFDADLLRVRRIRLTLRLQASDPAVRGSNPLQFVHPGTAVRSGELVRDATVAIDVTPRNLHQAW